MPRNPNKPKHKAIFYCPACKRQREHDSKEVSQGTKHMPGLGEVPYGIEKQYTCTTCHRHNYSQRRGKKRKAVF